MKLREELDAENDRMGTRAFCPSSITKLACVDVAGPKIACTSTFFIKSRAAFKKKNLLENNQEIVF